MEDMQSNDARRVAAWFGDDSELWIPPAAPVKGKGRIHALFRAMFNRYEFLQWTVLDILPVGYNRCIHICESHGKLKGRDAYYNRVITDIVFDEQGRIRTLSDYFKDTAVFALKR